MWRIVGLAGWLACSVAAAAAATPGPACVAGQVEGCIATMKNVFATPQQTRDYCEKAARKACEPDPKDGQ